MALTPYTAATDIIENLGTNPEDRTDLTDETFKAKFDENAANIKAFLNALIAELASTDAGKGASAIGVQDAGGLITATTVEAALAELAGTGRTTESLKSLADLISTHTADLITDSDGAHGLKIESGTWTPVIAGGSTPGSNTYAVQSGYYYKVGKMVTVMCAVTLSAKDAAMAGEIYVGGLPFVLKSSNGYTEVKPFDRYITYDSNGIGLTSVPSIILVGSPGASNLYLQTQKAGSESGRLDAAAIAANTLLNFTLTYVTN